jgi:UDP-MurNAc hydroxylase
MNQDSCPKLEKDNLRFLGHNCYLVENSETFLLIDPWLSGGGAFFGSWFQYPKNHHLRQEMILLSKKKKGFVYYTHEHQDHFDIETLNLLDTQTVVLIPGYKDKFLFESIRKSGFKCIELSENYNYSLIPNIGIRIFISEIGVNRDSAILVKTSNFVFLNQNDCKIFDRLQEIEEKITFYSVQFSGANGHPVCYTNYSEEQKVRISNLKNKNKLSSVIKAILFLDPQFYIPAAGPAIFPYLDEFLSFGVNNIFIHQDVLSKALISNGIFNVIYPLPGDTINNKPLNRKYIPPPSSAELAAYRSNTYNFWDSYRADFSVTKLKKVINDRLDQIWDLDFECDTLLQFQWGELASDHITIDLGAKKILDQVEISGKGIYVLKAEEKYFSLMCSGHRWQDISLSLRSEIYREPDDFNNFINLFLFSDTSNIRDSFLSSLSISAEKVTVRSKDGFCYSINRYCPHQGADLSNAEINENKELICPRHGWKFSLDNNGNMIDGNYSICALKTES